MRRLSSHNAALIAILSGVAFSANAQQKYKNPTGDKFPIVAYYEFHNEQDATKARFQKLAEGGFTLSMTRFENTTNLTNALNAINGTGVKLILCNSYVTSSTENATQFVSKYKDNTHIAMWGICDEPLPVNFSRWRPIIDAIAHASENRQMSHVNLNPIYIGTNKIGGPYIDYLRDAISEMNLPFISYDHYPAHEVLNTETNTWEKEFRLDFYSNFEQARQVARENGIPFWAFCMCSAHDFPNDPNNRYTAPTQGLLNLEAYAALAYGAQGLQYYRISAVSWSGVQFHDVPVDENGNTNFVWEYVKKINLDIQKHASIFLGNNVLNVWHTGTIPEGTRKLTTPPYPFTSISGNRPEGLIVSYFINGTRNFLMVVNKDYKYAQTVEIKRSSDVRRVNENGAFVRDNRVSFSIPEGGYMLFTWI